MATRRPGTDAAIAGLGAAALPFDKAAASAAHGKTRHGD